MTDDAVLLDAIMAHCHNHLTPHISSEKGLSMNDILVAHRYQGRDYTLFNQVARIVQIRKKRGQFGSDLFLLRRFDGTLMTAENQSFIRLPDPFIAAVSDRFTTSLEEETQAAAQGYIIRGVEAKGFVIDDDDTPVTPDDSFTITLTTHD